MGPASCRNSGADLSSNLGAPDHHRRPKLFGQPVGEVPAGVNFSNLTASTSVFSKVDVSFGEDLDGIGRKAGLLLGAHVC